MKHRRLVGCAGLLLFAVALVGISVYALALVRRYDPQAFANLPANPFIQKLTISGTVYATDPAQQESGHSITAGIAATVSCNGTQTTSSADGTYRLTLVSADTFLCTVTANVAYQPVRAVVPGATSGNLHVDFGPTLPASSCAMAHGSSTIVCPVLRPRPGTLSGTVTADATHQPAASIPVRCWNPSGGQSGNVDPYNSYTATTNAQGVFSLANLPVDRYQCNASGDWRLTSGSVAPSGTTQLALPLCQADCPAVSYHGGPVMHTFTAYLIYWLPSGYAYDAVGSGSFEHITSNYFQDVGGTPFYNLLTQYWDTTNGPVVNSATLGGTYVDTQPYPTAATSAAPLTDDDIQHEIGHALAANGWTTSMDHMFFVFTGYGAEICDNPATATSAGAAAGANCSYSATGFCGYHSATQDASPAIYALIVDNERCMGSPYDSPAASPNANRIADTALNGASHEQFEAVSDPLAKGWYDDHLVSGNDNRGEIGDKCEEQGGTVTLNHGHSYYIQSEWNDQTNGCAFSL